MSWLFIGSIIPSLLIAWLLSYAVRRYARSWGLVDLRSNEPPRSDREGRGPIPTGGGIAIWAAVVLPMESSESVIARVSGPNPLISLIPPALSAIGP